MNDEGFPESAAGYTAPAGFELLGHSMSRDTVIVPGEFGLLRDALLPKLISGELRVRTLATEEV